MPIRFVSFLNFILFLLLLFFNSSEETLMTARWYAAWILFFNVCIVFLMYGLWLTLTLTGKLPFCSN